MSRTQWVLALVLIIGGIVLQIPGHDDAMEGMDHGHESMAGMERAGAPADPAEEAGPYRTVVLAVTGMT